jgi:hypothetical protein
MSILGTFTKQPADKQDYDISFADWLAALGDTGLSHTSSITGNDSAATLSPASSLTAGVVKVWVSGGTDAVDYKVSVNLTTSAGRVKQVEIKIKVKET